MKAIFEAAGVNVAVLGNATDPKPTTDERKAEAQKLVPALKAGEITVGAIVKYVTGLDGHKLAQQQFYALAGWKPSNTTTPAVKAAVASPVQPVTASTPNVETFTITKAEKYLFDVLVMMANKEDLEEAHKQVKQRFLAEREEEIMKQIERELSSISPIVNRGVETPVTVFEPVAVPEQGKRVKEGVAEFLGRLEEELKSDVPMLDEADQKRLITIKESGNSHSDRAYKILELFTNPESNK
ncbi:hypothetical protein ACVTW2_000665 [Escherichia coli]